MIDEHSSGRIDVVEPVAASPLLDSETVDQSHSYVCRTPSNQRNSSALLQVHTWMVAITMFGE